jgi:hypothetical protein|eukprot:COSAG01_NODE_7353_length_3240_cov_2.739892_3_plen_76_part_00
MAAPLRAWQLRLTLGPGGGGGGGGKVVDFPGAAEELEAAAAGVQLRLAGYAWWVAARCAAIRRRVCPWPPWLRFH